MYIDGKSHGAGWQRPAGFTGFVKYRASKSPEILLGYEYENDNVRGHTRPNAPPKPQTPKNYEVNYEHIAEDDKYNAIRGWEYKSPVAPLFLHKLQVKALRRFTPFNMEPNGPKNLGGIHVNIERNELTEASSRKVFDFLHRKISEAHLIKLSGRDKRQFKIFSPQHSSITYEDQYYGVITSRKSYAYELRMFAAHPDLILPALEMGDALFRMAPEVEAITTDNFRNFVRDDVRYTNLDALLNNVFAA